MRDGVTKAAFREAMQRLRSGYPHRLAVDWPAVVEAYWVGLAHRYPRSSLLAAFAEAPHAHPDFFPTLGQLSKLAADHIRESRKPPPEPTPEPMSEQQREANIREVRRLIDSMH